MLCSSLVTKKTTKTLFRFQLIDIPVYLKQRQQQQQQNKNNKKEEEESFSLPVDRHPNQLNKKTKKHYFSSCLYANASCKSDAVSWSQSLLSHGSFEEEIRTAEMFCFMFVVCWGQALTSVVTEFSRVSCSSLKKGASSPFFFSIEAVLKTPPCFSLFSFPFFVVFLLLFLLHLFVWTGNCSKRTTVSGEWPGLSHLAYL